MAIILHFGFPKTATTSLQAFFHAERDLLAQQGVLYPIVDDDSKQRYLKSMISPPGAPVEPRIEKIRDKLNALRSLVERRKPSHVLLSCEELGNAHDFEITAETLVPLANYLKSIDDDVHLLAYVRNPEEYYLARMQEKLKTSGGVIAPASYRPLFAPTIAAYEAAFGKKAIVRHFQKGNLVGGSILEDFRTAIAPLVQLDFSGISEKRVNESLSPEVMFVLDMLRTNFADTDKPLAYSYAESSFLWRDLQKIAVQMSLTGKPVLRPAVARLIREGAAGEAAEIAEKYGIVFTDHAAADDGAEEHSSQAPLVSVESIIHVDRPAALSLLNRFALSGLRALQAKKSAAKGAKG